MPGIPTSGFAGYGFVRSAEKCIGPLSLRLVGRRACIAKFREDAARDVGVGPSSTGSRLIAGAGAKTCLRGGRLI